ncbi:MAG: alanine--tRNA ligase [Symbiobacteriaceae bacterium]|nr:alanine--tRNA ligase [Symbiobacteriaceae bacterium]
MKYMSSDEIRESFLSFFESKAHLRLPGASLIPVNDPSLLLIGAGMAPFKAYFTGIETPPAPRVTTVQRCVRTPDMDRVGQTGRHGTSFEMLGNFSFGEYFKREAISWSWEYVLEVLELPADKIYITVHENDDEAYDIWHDEIGIPKERIYRFGDEENFWEIGVGPCGPDSEIFIDRGPEYGCDSPECSMGCSCDRFLEIWNLVFTQFDKDKDGNLTPLARRCIDTGLGLDRVAMVLQGKHSLTEIDLHNPLLEHLIKITGVDYNAGGPERVALRVIVDHLKGVVLLIGDGVMPGNEERSYVLRRLMRRAARFGWMSGLRRPFMAEAARFIIETHCVGYPHLLEKADFICRVIDAEESRFHETLESGLLMVRQYISSMKTNNLNVLDGEQAFRLHDTFGFPLELTQELLEESGLGIDTAGFFKAMQQQRQRARDARGSIDVMGIGRAGLREFMSRFLGYDDLTMESEIIALWQKGEQLTVVHPPGEVDVILNVTPFYPEGGGEVADTGFISLGNEALTVSATFREAGTIVHRVTLGKQAISVGDRVQLVVDRQRREAISRHHSATHLLHLALRKVLGSHVHQSGSHVDEHRLRFDFSHFDALTLQELREVERQVNALIMANQPVIVSQMTYDEARAIGATALFDEKYGETVRVVQIGESLELCGGCHVRSSGAIGLLHILSESSCGSGLRRIEAVAGESLLELLNANEEVINNLSVTLKSNPAELMSRVADLIQQNRDLTRDLEKLRLEQSRSLSDGLMDQIQLVEGVKLIAAKVSAVDSEGLRILADHLRDRMGSGVVFLASENDGKLSLLAAATKDLVNIGVNAGSYLRALASILDGRGGGRPDLAQGGSSFPGKLVSALQQSGELLAQQIRRK